MRFSIVTIALNAEKYLAKTLHSTSVQEGVEFEHLLWDGGSKDKTLAIARSFPHVTLIEGKDRGISDAMNRAAFHAKGEFLLFLHADDLLAHSKVLLMYERILQLHPHVQWLYGKAHVIDEEDVLQRTTPYEPYSYKRLKRYNFLTHPATLVSHALFKQVGGFACDLRYCMDYDLWLRLGKVTTPLALATPLAYFREHKHSLSTSEPLGVTDEARRVRNRYITLLERYRSYRTWKKRRDQLTQ